MGEASVIARGIRRMLLALARGFATMESARGRSNIAEPASLCGCMRKYLVSLVRVVYMHALVSVVVVWLCVRVLVGRH